MTDSAALKPYHHGHLRQALLDAALELLTEQGLGGLTLRGVARRAGVSPAAPYHHFADKAALFEALLIETLEALAQAVREAIESTAGSPLEQLAAAGVAYVQFAVQHPAAFQILYRPELRQLFQPVPTEQGGTLSPIEQAGWATYQVLIDTIVVCQDAALIAPGDPLPIALTAWSAVHGLAQLLLEGVVPMTDREATLPEATRLGVLVTHKLVVGLLVR
jgi:AcrR family transcriptional regulator